MSIIILSRFTLGLNRSFHNRLVYAHKCTVNHDASAIFTYNHLLCIFISKLALRGMRLKQPPQALLCTVTMPARCEHFADSLEGGEV